MNAKNPYQSPTTPNDELDLEKTDPIDIRKKYLKTEAAFNTIGIAFFGIAVVLGVVMIATSIVGLRLGNQGTVLVSSALFIPIVLANVMIGQGLRKLESWARIPSTFVSLLLLVHLPIGTLIGGATLFLVYSEQGKRVFSDEYRQVMQATPDIKHKSHFTWVAIATIFIVVIALIFVWLRF